MLSGQVATTSAALLNTAMGKKEAGEVSLLDVLSAAFDPRGAGLEFGTQLTQLLHGDPANTGALPRPSGAVKGSDAIVNVAHEAPGPAPKLSAPASSSSTADRSSVPADTSKSAAEARNQKGDGASQSTLPVQHLDKATQKLKEAAKALDEGLRDPAAPGEGLAALVANFAVALQQVQTALEPFKAMGIPAGRAQQVTDLLASAGDVLSQLQQFLQPPEGQEQNTKQQLQSFGETLKALLGNQNTAEDALQIVQQLTSQWSAIKNTLASAQVARVASHTDAVEAVSIAPQPIQAPSATLQAGASAASASEGQTASSAGNGVDAGDASSPAPAAAAATQAQPVATKADAAGQSVPVIASVVPTDGRTGQQTFNGGQQSTQQGAVENLQGVGAASTASRAQSLSFEQHLGGAGGAKVIEQIQLQMKTAVKDGVTRIVMKLEPAELGEVEIKMEIGASGKTGVVISVDRPQTLALLQQDAKQLQQMLTDLGLKTDPNSLSFNLRGGDQQQANSQHYKPGKYPGLSDEFEEEVAAIVPVKTTLALRAGVNIKV